MNCSVSIFGHLAGGDTLYPDDYAQAIYQQFVSLATAGSAIVIHRDNDLMYYGYVRRLSVDGQYIGFCVLLNGLMFTHQARLFSLFEKTVEEMTAEGSLLRIDAGRLISDVKQLNDKTDEVARVIASVKSRVLALSRFTQKLPPVDYGTSISATKTFNYENGRGKDVEDASAKYSYTCVLKDLPIVHDNKPQVSDDLLPYYLLACDIFFIFFTFCIILYGYHLRSTIVEEAPIVEEVVEEVVEEAVEEAVEIPDYEVIVAQEEPAVEGTAGQRQEEPAVEREREREREPQGKGSSPRNTCRQESYC